MKNYTQDNILFFDSECVLCNSSVAFILKHEKNNSIKFCALNSDFANQTLQHYFINNSIPSSLIYLLNNKIHTKSTAVLYLCKNLKGLFPLLFCLIIIPAFLRNLIYNLIAKNRYKWFGKQNKCILPTESTKHRFIV